MNVFAKIYVVSQTDQSRSVSATASGAWSLVARQYGPKRPVPASGYSLGPFLNRTHRRLGPVGRTRERLSPIHTILQLRRASSGERGAMAAGSNTDAERFVNALAAAAGRIDRYLNEQNDYTLFCSEGPS
jgi:hypothetical protein